MALWKTAMFGICLAICQGHMVRGCRMTGCVDGACRVGSDLTFSCVCNHGYVLSQADNTTCLPMCPYKPCVNGQCFYTMNLQKVCVCNTGYVQSPTDPEVCIVNTANPPPVDPCRGVSCQNGHCTTNSLGIARCQCNPGYKLSSTNFLACEMIPQPGWGCTLQCQGGVCARRIDGSMYCQCGPDTQNDIFNPLLCVPTIYSPVANPWNNVDPFSSYLNLFWLTEM